jgi:anti-anti-sigma factor
MSSLPVSSSTASDLCDLQISVDWVRGIVVMRGELDRGSAHHLVDVVTSLAATGHPRWQIDTADVTWCDAGGLRALAAAHALAVECGGELLLVHTSRCVDRLVRMSGLDRMILAGLPPASAGQPKARRALRLVPAP